MFIVRWVVNVIASMLSAVVIILHWVMAMCMIPAVALFNKAIRQRMMDEWFPKFELPNEQSRRPD